MLNFPKAFSKNAENMNKINRFCNNNEKYIYIKKSFYESLPLIQFQSRTRDFQL